MDEWGQEVQGQLASLGDDPHSSNLTKKIHLTGRRSRSLQVSSLGKTKGFSLGTEAGRVFIHSTTQGVGLQGTTGVLRPLCFPKEETDPAKHICQSCTRAQGDTSY